MFASFRNTSLHLDGDSIGVGVAGPVEPVVVLQVHEDGYGLTQHNAAPHDHVPNLPSGKGESCQQAQGNLQGEVRRGGELRELIKRF